MKSNTSFSWVSVLVLIVTGCAGTPPIPDDDGRPLEGSIASLEVVTRQGDEYHLLLRGHDRTAPILLWLAGGTGGAVVLWLLDSRIHSPLTRFFLIVHGALLASLFLALLSFYFDILVPRRNDAGPFGKSPIRAVLGSLLGTVTYGGTAAAVRTLPGAPRQRIVAATGAAIGVMAVQGGFVVAGRIPHMIVISVFLVFIGVVMIGVGGGAPSPTMAWFVRRLGILIAIYAAVSALLYLLFAGIPFLAELGISLDFVFYFLWSALSIAAFVRHMVRPVAIIEDTGVSPAFCSAYSITPREAEIIELIGQGLSNQQIADRLHV